MLIITGETQADAREQIASWLEYRARRIRSGADNEGRRATPEMVEDLARELAGHPDRSGGRAAGTGAAMILNYWVVEPMHYGHRAVQYRSGKDGHGREVSGTTGGRLTFRRGGPDATLEALRTFLRDRRCVEPMSEGPALEALRRVYPNMIEAWW